MSSHDCRRIEFNKAHINFEVRTRFDILFVLIVKKSILGNFTGGEDKQKMCQETARLSA